MQEKAKYIVRAEFAFRETFKSYPALDPGDIVETERGLRINQYSTFPITLKTQLRGVAANLVYRLRWSKDMDFRELVKWTARFLQENNLRCFELDELIEWAKSAPQEEFRCSAPLRILTKSNDPLKTKEWKQYAQLLVAGFSDGAITYDALCMRRSHLDNLWQFVDDGPDLICKSCKEKSNRPFKASQIERYPRIPGCVNACSLYLTGPQLSRNCPTKPDA